MDFDRADQRKRGLPRAIIGSAAVRRRRRSLPLGKARPLLLPETVDDAHARSRRR
jgi:hypothetical protein